MGGGLAKAQAAGEPAVPRPLHAVERFDEFYLREYRATVTLAWALSGSCLVAEDLAQEAFMLAWRQWPQIGGYQQPAAGVRRVVANLATSTIRRRLAEARRWSVWRPAGQRTSPSCRRRRPRSGGRCGQCPAARPRCSPCTTCWAAR
jgi:hypothetical protein